MTKVEYEAKVAELVQEALAEDKREGGRFDEDGWSNYFHEDWKICPDAVRDAWFVYDEQQDSKAKASEVARGPR
jgi:hypothetical protein